MIKYHLNTADMEIVTLSHYADDDFERVSMNILHRYVTKGD